MEYNFKQIEKKWQDYWYANNTFAAKQDFSLPKYYCLVEFPYPSGAGLHVGLQCVVPHGLGRLWPAYRELRH